MNISEDSQRRPKTSEEVQSLPKTNLHSIADAETALAFPSPSPRACIAKHDLTPGAFYLKEEISSFTLSFHFLHRFESTYF